MKLGVIAADEGETGHENEVEDNPCGPDVGLEGIIRHFLYKLGTHIARSAAEDIGLLPRLGADAEAEVDDLHHPLFAHQHILQLYVSVAHSSSVAVLQAAYQLPKYISTHILSFLSTLPQHVILQAVLVILTNQIYVLLILTRV